MEFTIFVLFSIIGSSHSEPTKSPRDDMVSVNFDHQQTASLSALLSNKSNSNNGEIKGHVNVLKAPLKLEYDKNLYRVIRLSNDLTVLLISTQENESIVNSKGTNNRDKENLRFHQKKSACSLHIDMGSFSDPRDVQGLSHLIGNFDILSHQFWITIIVHFDHF